jgi:drug/metabolite transporter (DMT)-like permease
MPVEVQSGTSERLPNQSRIRLLVGMVLLSVGLQLVNAALVKLASATPSPAPLVIAGLLAVVLALSFMRFFIWNGIYRRYPISLAYPLSAIFFPAVVVLAWAMGEPIGLLQILGAAIVMVGVIRVISPEPGHPDEPHLPVID